MDKHLIPAEFLDYLEANGFVLYPSSDGHSITYGTREKSVYLKYDKATFYQYYEGSDDEAPDFSEYGSVSGLDQLDMFKWQLILHAFDVVPLRSFIQRARKESTDEDITIKTKGNEIFENSK